MRNIDGASRCYSHCDHGIPVGQALNNGRHLTREETPLDVHDITRLDGFIFIAGRIICRRHNRQDVIASIRLDQQHVIVAGGSFLSRGLRYESV